MSKQDEPAFPVVERTEHIDGAIVCHEWPGISRRELIAAMAMSAHKDIRHYEHPNNYALIANSCVAMADALLSALREDKEDV